LSVHSYLIAPQAQPPEKGICISQGIIERCRYVAHEFRPSKRRIR
jgi:hypothetical protein